MPMPTFDAFRRCCHCLLRCMTCLWAACPLPTSLLESLLSENLRKLGIATHFQEASTASSTQTLESPLTPSPPPSSSSSSSSTAPPTSPLTYMFDTTVSTPLNRCRVAVFRCLCDLIGPSGPSHAPVDAGAENADSSNSSLATTIQFQASEVQSGQWEPRTVVAADATASWTAHVLGGDHVDSISNSNGIVDGNGSGISSGSPSSSAGSSDSVGGGAAVMVATEGGKASSSREFVPDGLAVWHAFLEWEDLQILPESVSIN